MRVVQVANFVGPESGGIRTVLGRLAAGYAAAGHEIVQILPGERREVTAHDWGVRVQLPGRVLPGTGYRLLAAAAVIRELTELRPDRLEVHDRTTLRRLGRWSRAAGVPACVISHERLDRLLEQWTRGRVPTGRLADRSNRRLAAGFHSVVCTTAWAAEEFTRLGVPNLSVVPLGVDTTLFTPAAADPAVRRRYAPGGGALLAMVIRLSPEKSPALAIEAVREMVRRGERATLVVAGDGPLRRRLEHAARGLPVHFLGHLTDPAEVAALLATADVVLAPGPVETFGLAALEALASGTPVVVNARSALPSVVGSAGIAAAPTPGEFAAAAQALLRRPGSSALAREHALGFRWDATVHGFLAVHHLAPARTVAE